METKNRTLVNQLEEILEKNRDAQKGYAKAAENAKNQNLKAYFQNKSGERGTFNQILNKELVASYDEIDNDGSFTGSLHRAWMDVKSFFTGDNDESMLEEAIRGDKAAVEEYEEVLNDKLLPSNVALVIREQLVKIRTDLNKVKSMEDLVS
ncbi:conserved hypothetical protein [Maribacter dokdonensis]|uniref:ferritin-like domain-containing protein n=1 Tax=Maribacter dokdonensis TaxID=320912 RepID=UPI001B0935BB|nr:PA2169 family four-helix-bundle protein [Maribacter dokdonensis]CAG2534051.1 conserved hypothetical protein [Maribacter dokdonensis]